MLFYKFSQYIVYLMDVFQRTSRNCRKLLGLALLVDCTGSGRGASVYSVVLEKVVLSRWCFVLWWTGKEKVRQRPARR